MEISATTLRPADTVNVNADEIDKFSQIAQEWWDPLGKVKTLHQINPLRLSFIKNHSTTLENKKILDLGCGGGILTEALAKEGAQVTGVDMSSALIQAGRQHSKISALENIEYLNMSVEELCEQPNRDQYFDTIVCMEMLEHVPSPESIVKSCSRLLKPEGKIFFSTLNRTWNAWLKAILAAEYLLKMLPKGTHHYQDFIRPSELTQWARIESLELEAMAGIDYNPLKDKFSLCKQVDVNYLAVFTKNSL